MHHTKGYRLEQANVYCIQYTGRSTRVCFHIIHQVNRIWISIDTYWQYITVECFNCHEGGKTGIMVLDALVTPITTSGPLVFKTHLSLSLNWFATSAMRYHTLVKNQKD